MLHLIITDKNNKTQAVTNKRLTKVTRNYNVSDNLNKAADYSYDKHSDLEIHCNRFNTGRTDGLVMQITDSDWVEEYLAGER